MRNGSHGFAETRDVRAGSGVFLPALAVVRS
jgi:hypothetical protein